MTKSYSSLRSFLFVIFFLGFAFPLLGEDSVIKWTPQWKVGDQYSVEQVKERVVGKAIVRQTVLIDIQVKEKGDDYFILQCTYGASKLQALYGKFEMKDFQKFAPEAKQMENITDGMSLKIKTESDGTPIELLNVDEVMKMASKTMDWMEAFRKKINIPQEEIDQSISEARDFFAKNQELVSNLMLSELAPLFTLCGAELILGKVSEFDDFFPNTFGGEPFPAKVSILLKEFNKQTGIATIEYEVIPDGDKFISVMAESINKLNPKNPMTLEENVQFSISSKTLYKIDTKKGWTVSVENENNAVVTENGSKTQDVRRFRFKTLKKIK